MNNEEPKPNIKMDRKTSDGGKVTKPNSNSNSMLSQVVAKVNEAESVLVALSNDPSVDEIAAALGLSMALDSSGKRVTAIYSGKTPNVLEFLKPSERFETNTDSLQDFIIALDKDKADHLRYKIDGDFVKVYVTPYKTTISGDDLEFSRGDFNVDLVISLNVPAVTELDAALKEYGRIMHDATSINITNGVAGKFGDVEWVEPSASSISEMVAGLAFEINEKMDPATATALLTGLVAATDRFSNPATTPDAMVLAAKLMGAGANQQLVVQNMRGEVLVDGGGSAPSASASAPSASASVSAAPAPAEDASKLEISHEEESVVPAPAPAPAPMNSVVAGVDVATTVPNGDGYAGEMVANRILDSIEKEESKIGAADYGKMIDEALNEPVPGEGGIQVGTQGAEGPQVDTQNVEDVGGSIGTPMNPASEQAPVMGAMDAAGVPEMNFQMGNMMTGPSPVLGPSPMLNPMPSQSPSPVLSPNPMPMPEQEMTPPPVLPQPDFGAMPPVTPEVSVAPAAPEANVTPVVPVTPVVQAAPDANVAPTPVVEKPMDPSAFIIPGIHS
ncbi:hypothetical protein IKE71_02905 [Candidatus Saccharibacteria bacterium]|nr:hypothetical protein [Candidatus Saccharibacteria bacterium]